MQLNTLLGGQPGFLTHLYRALRQDQQCRAVLLNLPMGVLFINADFSMNLVLNCKREAQPLFYFSRQLSLLVMIIHYIRNGVMVCEHHYFISEDKDHDRDFVQYSLDLLVAHLAGRGLHFQAHNFFTDGGPGHFKSAAAFMGAVSHAFFFSVFTVRFTKRNLDSDRPPVQERTWGAGDGSKKGK